MRKNTRGRYTQHLPAQKARTIEVTTKTKGGKKKVTKKQVPAQHARAIVHTAFNRPSYTQSPPAQMVASVHWKDTDGARRRGWIN